MIKKPIVILYHVNCSDGFGGAWAAWKKFGSRAEYIGVYHQVPLPAGLRGRELYMIDFTYPLEITKKLIKENRRVTAIDHHISAEKATKLTKNFSYAINHSGSVLAWKYFHPKKPVPRMLINIEDMDLWRFKAPYTKEIFAYLNLFEFNFKVWDKIAAGLENPKIRKKYIESGSVVLRYEDRLIDRLVANNAELVEFAGNRALAVNTPNFASQIGNLLTKKLPPIGITWSRKKGKIDVSLRSNGKVDVSKIAKKFGGGGHKAASGFSIPANQKLPWKFL